MRFRSVLAWVPVVVIFVACGSDDSEGDGSGGKTTCAAGATQACTCNGTDTGAQVCAGDGKSWGACGCGASGGTGGSGGTSGDASTGGSGGVTGGTGATSGADSGSVGDPCPTEPLLADCSGQCGEPSCAMCVDVAGPSDTNDAPKYMLRTHANPGAANDGCCNFGGCCRNYTGPEWGSTKVGFVHFEYYKVKVGSPWRLGFQLEPNSIVPCNITDFAPGCLIVPKTNGTYPGRLYVVTEEANAPARNVTVEVVPFQTTCSPAEYWQ